MNLAYAVMFVIGIILGIILAGIKQRLFLLSVQLNWRACEAACEWEETADSSSHICRN